MKEDISHILECAGLIHDIGNPPFGHFGEEAIRDWFLQNLPALSYRGKRLDEMFTDQMKADFYHFEGNAQALRLVTKLHYLVDEHGMNLTYALLNTIIKYPVSSLEINEKSGNIRDKEDGILLCGYGCIPQGYCRYRSGKLQTSADVYSGGSGRPCV